MKVGQKLNVNILSCRIIFKNHGKFALNVSLTDLVLLIYAT